MELTTAEYAAYGILVTTEEEVDGSPTVPLGLALHVADDQADFEDHDDYDF